MHMQELNADDILGEADIAIIHGKNGEHQIYIGPLIKAALDVLHEDSDIVVFAVNAFSPAVRLIK